MLFHFAEDGTLTVFQSEKLNQGSVRANKIEILTKFSQTGAILVGFELPNGQRTTVMPMTPAGTAEGYSLYTFVAPANLLSYPGALVIQAFYTLGDLTEDEGGNIVLDGETLASTKVTVNINRGTASFISTASTADWNALLAVYQQCRANALVSEGYAVGEQDGETVGEDSPYWENNAKYYAEQAVESSGSAAEDAQRAEDARDRAETAQAAAEAAQAASETAQAEAESARDEAEEHKNAAASSASAASESAESAAGSASSASSSAAAASASASQAAESAEDAGESAAEAAEYLDEMDEKYAAKQNAKPDGTVPLISGTTGKLSMQYIPDEILGNVSFLGVWNASTGVSDPTYDPTKAKKGGYWICATAGGTKTPDGQTSSITFEVGDWALIIADTPSIVWHKVDNTDAVTMVNGRIGAIETYRGELTVGTAYKRGDFFSKTVTDTSLFLVHTDFVHDGTQSFLSKSYVIRLNWQGAFVESVNGKTDTNIILTANDIKLSTQNVTVQAKLDSLYEDTEGLRDDLDALGEDVDALETEVAGKSSVSGEYASGKWTKITIDGVENEIPGSEESYFFIATFNSTTYEAAQTAYNSGLAFIVIDNGKAYTCSASFANGAFTFHPILDGNIVGATYTLRSTGWTKSTSTDTYLSYNNAYSNFLAIGPAYIQTLDETKKHNVRNRIEVTKVYKAPQMTILSDSKSTAVPGLTNAQVTSIYNAINNGQAIYIEDSIGGNLTLVTQRAPLSGEVSIFLSYLSRLDLTYTADGEDTDPASVSFIEKGAGGGGTKLYKHNLTFRKPTNNSVKLNIVSTNGSAATTIQEVADLINGSVVTWVEHIILRNSSAGWNGYTIGEMSVSTVDNFVAVADMIWDPAADAFIENEIFFDGIASITVDTYTPIEL